MKWFKYIVFLFIGFTACQTPDYYYEEIVELPGYSWNKDHRLDFSFEVIDTTKNYDILVFIRHSELYKWSNLWLMVYTTFPDGKIIDQRVEIELADKEGKWFGNCRGDLCSYSIPIQKNAIFNMPGTYRLGIEQIMRQDELEGVLNFGINLTEAKSDETH